MRRRVVAGAWLAALGIAGWTAAAAAQSLPLQAPAQFDRVLATAKAQRQLVLVYVSSRTCPWCRHFERTHLSDPAFIAWANAVFQVVAADGEDPAQSEWLARKGLGTPEDGFPRYYILDANGQRLAASGYSAKFTPLKGVQLFEQALSKKFDLDPGRLTAAARELASWRQRAATDEHRLAYGAMEALTWHWLGNGRNALSAFGPDVAARLAQRPGPGDDPEAWDEIRLWYCGFWSACAQANFEGAFRVAAAGYEQRNLPQYAWWAAFLGEQLGRLDFAVRYGEDYLRTVQPPANHPFRRRVADWKRQAATSK